MKEKPIRVLLELRPALEGFAGIPQETRLLFRGLCVIDNVELQGMLVTPFGRLAHGTSDSWLGRLVSRARRTNRYSRVVVSMSEKPYRNIFDVVYDYLVRRSESLTISLLTLLGLYKVTLTNFESRMFEDFIWRTLFAKTLPAADFPLVTAKNHKICAIGWDSQQNAGLFTLNFLQSPLYPKLDTKGFDIFIAQTPYPARVRKGTACVIRYHDAIPIFLPHTVNTKSKHQAQHFFALMGNVKAGAHFACVSDASREALLHVFPEIAERAITIHNMVSEHYYVEESSPQRVPQIIRARLERESELATPRFLTLREQASFYRRVFDRVPFKYLLIVSTVEPRKNHSRLLAAWEILKAEVDPALRLVVVGGLGWDYEAVMRAFRPWVEQGEAFFLTGVPAPDLRVLYRHALATVCPSLAEGFDYAGIESMRSGGVVVASDIPVHREVYGAAAEYFDPYSTRSLVKSIKSVVYDAQATAVQSKLRRDGEEVSARYLPENILPQWRAFLERVAGDLRR